MPDSPVAVIATPLTVGPETARHPLATRTGLSMLNNLITAGIAWSGCTPLQRTLLAEWCEPIVARLREHPRERTEITTDEMPVITAGLQARTVEALRRRRLIDGDGRLTGVAVHAYYWAVAWKRKEDDDG